MAPIERKPLPPPNFKATTITEADRAEMIAQANAVIDYYLNGPGSYWDAGPRKPLVGELGDSTVNDLRTFKEGVIASKQFADDPDLIMDSIIGLIDQATRQVQEAAQNSEGRDGIWRVPPTTDDPIDDPRVISPRMLDDAAVPIALKRREPALPPQAGGSLGISGSAPMRILSRRIVNQSPAAVVSPSVRAALEPSDIASGPGEAHSVRVLSSRVLPRGDIGSGSSSNSDTSSWLVRPSQSDRPLGLLTGEPMPRWPVQLPIWDFPDRSGDSRELKDPSVPLFEQYIRYLNQANGV